MKHVSVVKELRITKENSGTSVRRLSDAVGIYTNLVWRMLYEQLFYLYQRMQAFTLPDYQARIHGVFQKFPNFHYNLLC